MLNRVIGFERDRRIAWEPTPGDAVAARNAGLPIGTSQGYIWGFQQQHDQIRRPGRPGSSFINGSGFVIAGEQASERKGRGSGGLGRA